MTQTKATIATIARHQVNYIWQYSYSIGNFNKYPIFMTVSPLAVPTKNGWMHKNINLKYTAVAVVALLENAHVKPVWKIFAL